jgi:Concanavalin A-like lectin/glucanases superfamily/Bacterial Ig-like domain (group 2)
MRMKIVPILALILTAFFFGLFIYFAQGQEVVLNYQPTPAASGTPVPPPILVGSVTTATTTSCSSPGVTAPTGIAQGDYLIGVIGGDAGTVTSGTLGTSLGRYATGHGFATTVLGTAVGASPPSTVTFSTTGNFYQCQLRDYRYIDTTPILDPASSNPQNTLANTSAAGVSGLTTTITNDLALFSATLDSNSSIASLGWGTPSGFGNGSGFFGTFSANNVTGESWDEVLSSAGATGALSSTCSTCSGTLLRNVGGLLVLAHATPNGPTPTPTPSTYQTAVSADSPNYNWRLNEATGPTATDSADSNNGAYGSIGSLGNTGATRTGDTAAAFNGTSSMVTTTTSQVNPGATGYTLEGWFKSGVGPIIQLNNQQGITTGASYDRQIYIGTDNKVYFGQYPGGVVTVVSPSTYTDTNWHYVVGVYDGSNLNLYIDGNLVAGPTAVGAPQNYTGYWAIGAGREINLWPNSTASSSNVTVFFTGQLQDIAYYPVALSGIRIGNHFSGSDPTLSSIAVALNPTTIYFGGSPSTSQATATGTYSNNSTANIGACTWSSLSNPTATVSNTGLVTAQSTLGSATIKCVDP